MFKYGMRLRGFSPACQPTNKLKRIEDDPSGKYYDILVYSRPLEEHEQKIFDLDYLGKTD